MLAAVMAKWPDELRADLQQYYGIDLDHAIAGEHTADHVAALVRCLPSDARVMTREDPDAMWTLETVLLASLLNAFTSFMWGMSDKTKRGKRPDPVGPSYIAIKRKLPAMVMTIDELERQLAAFEKDS